MNDRDGLTDMTLLHYTCKSGAHGIGKYMANLLMASGIYTCACISCVYVNQRLWEGT